MIKQDSHEAVQTPPLRLSVNPNENQVKELEITVESMARRLAAGGADEIARIRRDVQNNDGAMYRRIEEVHTCVFLFGIRCNRCVYGSDR